MNEAGTYDSAKHRTDSSLQKKSLRSRALTISLSGRLLPFNRRRGRKMSRRSRRTRLTFHGRSKRWLDSRPLEVNAGVKSAPDHLDQHGANNEGYCKAHQLSEEEFRD